MKAQILVAPAVLSTFLAVSNAYAKIEAFTPDTPPTVVKAINQTIGSPTSIDISPLGPISGLALNGHVSLATDKAYVRVVMVTSAGEERLVLETNPLLANGRELDLDEYCEETKRLDNLTPALLRFELGDASLMLTSVSASPPTAAAQNQLHAGVASGDSEAQLAEKLQAVRMAIKQRGLHWIAGNTPVARKTYAEKKALFGGKLPNLAGLEYYIGGIFEIPPYGAASAAPATASPYVPDFSWRNKHGQSWMTDVRDQDGCGSCWAFAATGATELLVNLYFNQHVNLDLAEQDALSCMSGGSCSGGNPWPVLDFITRNGIYEEACFPYTASDQACANGCSNPSENIRIGGHVTFSNDAEDTLKSMILTSAVSMGIVDWWHVLTLAGYRTLKEGDSFYIRGEDGIDQWVTITANDGALIGRTVWELKNSWGPGFGADGYVWVLTELSNIYLTDQLLPPVLRMGHSDAEIACVDSDGDGYYAWGVGPKPAQCPADSPAQPDGDDSDPCKGPMDPYGFMSNLCEAVHGDFVASDLSPCIGTAITFTDQSTGPVTGWSWDFGPGAVPATATGKGPIEVKYTTAGSKTVVLSVTSAGSSQDMVTKTNYVKVPWHCNPYQLEVYARNQGCHVINQFKPRTYITNTGTTPLSNFKLVFTFTTNGKHPRLDDWYTPHATVRLQPVARHTYKVIYDFAGTTLGSGEVVPDTSGDLINLHYGDWSPWRVLSKFRPGCSFALNTDVAVYDQDGNLIYGTAQ